MDDSHQRAVGARAAAAPDTSAARRAALAEAAAPTIDTAAAIRAAAGFSLC